MGGATLPPGAADGKQASAAGAAVPAKRRRVRAPASPGPEEVIEDDEPPASPAAASGSSQALVLVKQGSGLVKAAWEGKLLEVRHLLKERADPNAFEAHLGGATRVTPLMAAAAGGRVAICAELLCAAADPDLKSASDVVAGDLTENDKDGKRIRKLLATFRVEIDSVLTSLAASPPPAASPTASSAASPAAASPRASGPDVAPASPEAASPSGVKASPSDVESSPADEPLEGPSPEAPSPEEAPGASPEPLQGASPEPLPGASPEPDAPPRPVVRRVLTKAEALLARREAIARVQLRGLALVEKALCGFVSVSAETLNADGEVQLAGEAALQGEAARLARKQRHEAKELARIEAVAKRVAARRSGEEEEERLKRVAEKAAARRNLSPEEMEKERLKRMAEKAGVRREKAAKEEARKAAKEEAKVKRLQEGAVQRAVVRHLRDKVDDQVQEEHRDALKQRPVKRTVTEASIFNCHGCGGSSAGAKCGRCGQDHATCLLCSKCRYCGKVTGFASKVQKILKPGMIGEELY